MYKVIKFIYEKECNNADTKTYSTKEEAQNAGDSWEKENTPYLGVIKGRWFEIVSI